MNEDILIRCEICDKIFNPGILNVYPWGFIVICDECYNNSAFKLNF